MTVKEGQLVRCPCCLREEVWTEEGVTVRVPGGRRLPAKPAALAAWDILRAHIDGRVGPVVGACDGCAQPLVGQPGMPVSMWTLELPDGALQIDTEVRGPNGSITPAEAEAKLLRHYTPPMEPAQAMFSGMLLTTMLVPMLLWMAAATTFFSFLYLLWAGGTTVPN